MRIGRFDHDIVEPIARRNIRPDLCILVKACRIYASRKNAIDERHCLCTGDGVIGSEFSVRVTGDPTGGCRLLDVSLCPVPRKIRKLRIRSFGQLHKAGCHGHKLRTRNIRLGIKLCRAASAHKTALYHGGDRLIRPSVVRHIDKIVCLCQKFCPHIILQKAIEDHRNFLARNVIVRADRSVRIAENVRIMIIHLQRCRACRADPASVQRHIAADTQRVLHLFGHLAVRIPTVKFVSGLGRDRKLFDIDGSVCIHRLDQLGIAVNIKSDLLLRPGTRTRASDVFILILLYLKIGHKRIGFQANGMLVTLRNADLEHNAALQFSLQTAVIADFTDIDSFQGQRHMAEILLPILHEIAHGDPLTDRKTNCKRFSGKTAVCLGKKLACLFVKTFHFPELGIFIGNIDRLRGFDRNCKISLDGQEIKEVQ